MIESDKVRQLDAALTVNARRAARLTGRMGAAQLRIARLSVVIAAQDRKIAQLSRELDALKRHAGSVPKEFDELGRRDEHAKDAVAENGAIISNNQAFSLRMAAMPARRVGATLWSLARRFWWKDAKDPQTEN